MHRLTAGDKNRTMFSAGDRLACPIISSSISCMHSTHTAAHANTRVRTDMSLVWKLFTVSEDAQTKCICS